MEKETPNNTTKSISTKKLEGKRVGGVLYLPKGVSGQTFTSLKQPSPLNFVSDGIRPSEYL